MEILKNKSRIAILREMLGLSQIDFASKAGITQGALSQLEAGKSKLSLDTLKSISVSYNANCNWLVHGNGNIFMKEKEDISTLNATRDGFQLSETALIPLILEEARAGYIKGHKDTDYLSTLAVYKIPGFENGNYRLFEIQGDSMTPTIHPREIVISEEVKDWKSIENGTLCIIITDEDIVAKRFYLHDENANQIILKSDNSEYKTYTVDLDDVHEFWEIRAKITDMFNDIGNTAASQIKILSEDVEELKAQIKNLAKREN